MKACPQMQAVIEQLAKKYEVDLAQEGAVIQLDMEGYDTLYIGNSGNNSMVVAHYREQDSGIQADPEVVFFLDSMLGWIPIRVNMVIGGVRAHAQLSEDASEITDVNVKSQADLADFIEETWVLNLRLQEWLEQGQLRPEERRIRKSSTSGLFLLGRVVATPGALSALEEAGQNPAEFLTRHTAGDWGELCAEDKEANDQALVNRSRILSSYFTTKNVKIWVITEWDRSSTCLLLPMEY